jgi:four helix bundle protein
MPQLPAVAEGKMADAIKSFEDLEVWRAVRELKSFLRELIKKFPDSEKYRLVDQIIRAKRSVTANIAEGFGRYYFQENIQFCRTARGSLSELLDHMITSFDNLYISEGEYSDARSRIINCMKLLNGYIRSLKKTKKGISDS